jgi:ribosome-associated heat shock protein Hsp15
MSAPEAQRIDKWLWHARFARTRGAAQTLAVSGHVRINREKVAAPSRLVRPGDILTLSLRGGVRVIEVTAIAERRGGAAEARSLYDDRTGPETAAPPQGSAAE